MVNINQETYSGHLYSWIKEPESDWKQSDLIVCHPLDVSGWYQLSIKTSDPILPDEQKDREIYEYTFLLRESQNNRFLLLSKHLELVTFLVEKISGVRPYSTYNPSIDIPQLVNDISIHPQNYCLGIVFGRVEGFGNSLRLMALYGNDLAEASLFNELRPYLTPYRVSLRDVRRSQEIVSIGSKGEVLFYYRGLSTLKDIDIVLRYLSDNGYVSWAFNSD